MKLSDSKYKMVIELKEDKQLNDFRKTILGSYDHFSGEFDIIKRNQVDILKQKTEVKAFVASMINQMMGLKDLIKN